MAAKKKKKTARHVRKIKITPPIAASDSVNFSSLKSTECFLMSGSLWMKMGNSYSQNAFDLVNGLTERNLCGRKVVPITVEIKWEKRSN